MIDKDIEYLNKGLLINEFLVIGDIHLGYSEKSYRVVYPQMQLDEIKKEIDEIFDFVGKNNRKIKKIILLGDIKHRFKNISSEEWRETLQFMDFLIQKVGKKNIIVIKGNHDVSLDPILKKRDIKLKKFYEFKLKINKKLKKFFFCHGNILFKQCLDSDYIVFGHLHPAIILEDKYKSEKYKCFMKGKWGKKQVFILPSFSEISRGINLGKLNNYKNDFSIIPNKNLKNFEIVIYNNKDKKEHSFGKLKEL